MPLPVAVRVVLCLLAATIGSISAFLVSAPLANKIVHAYTYNEERQLPWPVGVTKNPGIGATQCTYNCPPGHINLDKYAIDFNVYNAPVSATLAGTAHITSDPCGGTIVWIDHGGGLISYYAHLDPAAVLLSEGAAVYQGQPIAFSGNSGTCSTGPHLHFAMHYGATTWNDGFAYKPEPMAAPQSDGGTYSGFDRYGSGTGVASPAYTAAISPTEYRPAAVSMSSLRLDLFVRGTDNGVYHRYTTDDVTWPGGWENLGYGGFGFNGEPAVASWGSGRLDIFATSCDGNLYHKAWTGTAWYPSSGWENDNQWGCGGVTGTPSVAAYSFNGLMVVARGTDRTIKTCQWNGTNWISGSIGGYTSTDPVVVSPATNFLELVILGGDNAVWHTEWTSSWIAWQRWDNPANPSGTTLVSQPTLTYLSASNIDVLALGSDGNLWDKHDDGMSWSGWIRLVGSQGPGTIVGSPSATEWPTGAGLFSVFIRDATGALWDCWPTLGSNPTCVWTPHSGALTSDPLVVTVGLGSYREDDFARASYLWNFSVAHQMYNAGSWNPSQQTYDNLGGTMT